jgi:hypothetical protein
MYSKWKQKFEKYSLYMVMGLIPMLFYESPGLIGYLLSNQFKITNLIRIWSPEVIWGYKLYKKIPNTRQSQIKTVCITRKKSHG